jgi:hypothetical protein
MNHLNEEQLIEFRYGEAKDCAEIENHLRACASCREALESLESVLAAVDAAPVPERDEAYGARVWRQIEPKLERRPGFDWRAWLAPPRLAFVGAMALVIVAAFVAGRYWPRPKTTEVANAPISAPVRERILLVAVGDHLDRSQMLLLELENAEPPKGAGAGVVDISMEQGHAQDLVVANRLYRQTAERSGNTTLATVLDELEPVLLQIVHSPSKLSASQLGEIQKRIEARGILFKVRVVGSEVREREKNATPEAAPTPAPAREKS